MATIAIIGGSGQVGRVLARELTDRGNQVRIVSRSPRHGGAPARYEWATVNYKTGDGLSDALTGCDAAVFVVGGLKEAPVIAAALAASPANLPVVYLSIVGIDQLPMAYYRAKMAAENVIRGSAHPWTILRATQFHSLVWRLLFELAKIPGVMPVPRLHVQPVAVIDVARRLADLVQGQPLGDIDELGGPEIFELGELAQQYLQSRGKKRRIVRFTVPGKLKAGFAAGANLAPNNAAGTGTYSQYMDEKRRK